MCLPNIVFETPTPKCFRKNFRKREREKKEIEREGRKDRFPLRETILDVIENGQNFSSHWIEVDFRAELMALMPQQQINNFVCIELIFSVCKIQV